MRAREQTLPHAPQLIAYAAGLTTVIWISWVLFCAIGVFAGNTVPVSWQLDLAVTRSFIAITATSIRNVPMGAAALVGGAAGVLPLALPLKLGLIAACLAGLMAGLLAQKMVAQKS